MNETMTIHLINKVAGYVSLLVKLELALKTTCADFFTLVVHEKTFITLAQTVFTLGAKLARDFVPAIYFCKLVQ